MERIIRAVIEEINEYWSYIEKAINVDKKYGNINLKKDELINIISSYSEEKMKEEKSDSKVLVSYYGYPYITASICMDSIIKRTDLILLTEDFCLAINSVLVEIFNNIIKEIRSDVKIEIKDSMQIDKIKRLNDKSQLICIGNESTYINFYRADLNPTFIPFNNILLYCGDTELEDLKRKIYDVCMENYFEIEIFGEEDNFESVIDAMNNSECAKVLLTRGEEEKRIFKEKIKGKYYINKNPIQYIKTKVLFSYLNDL